jgi:hypothetical protein
MEHVVVIREVIEIELHPDNMNRASLRKSDLLPLDLTVPEIALSRTTLHTAPVRVTFMPF